VLVVAVPAFNAAGMIGPTLESLEAQSDPAFEVLVADNASTDETAKVVQAFADRGRLRITLVRHAASRGRLGNWAYCIEHALGAGAEWLKWLFAGDRLRPTAIADLRRCAAEHPDVGLIVADYTIDAAPPTRHRALADGGRLAPVEALARFARGGNWFGAPLGQMYHRRALEQAELGELGWVADCRLALEAARRAPVLYAPVDIGVFDTAHRRYYGAVGGTVAALAEECVIRHLAIDMLLALDPRADAAALRAAVDAGVARGVVAGLPDGELATLGLRRGLRRWARATLRALAARAARRGPWAR
jgi:glycosyltransferase involved in cell wall biosynthesis